MPDEHLLSNKDYFFDFLKIIDKDTIHISNLECPLTTSRDKIFKTGPNLKADTSFVECLKRAKVDYTCLANNHIKDYGTQGISDTIRTCADNKIGVVGAGLTEKSARKPIIIEQDNVKIGILNYCEEEYNGETGSSYGANLIDEINIWYDIKEIKNSVDLLFVVLHWGKEMYHYPTPRQARLAKYIIDQGADGIIGHHSHVRGSYEVYKGKPIIYSLGNFYFQENNPDKEWFKGVFCKISINSKKIDKINIYSYEQTNKLLNISESIELKHNNLENGLVEVNKEIIQDEWENVLSKNLTMNVSRLVTESRIRKFLIQKRYSKLSQKEIMKLLILRNKFRCRTHREYTESLINNYFHKN